MQDARKRMVLFIADSMAQYEDLERLIGKKKYEEVTFRYPEPIGQEKKTIKKLLEDCKKVINECDIEGIVTLHPGNTLVQAVLLKEFNDMNWKGPTFQGALMCLHKYYNKQKVLTDFHFNFAKVEVEDKVIADYISALEETGEPGYLVDAIGTNESLVKKIRSDKLSMREIESIRKSVVKNYDHFRELIDEHAEKDKHPWVMEPLCVVSSYWKDYDNVSFHLAECCVPENEESMIHWALTDVVYGRGDRKCLKYVSMPSVIEEGAQMDIWGSIRMVCNRLCNFGFKQHFFHALIASTREGAVKIVDLNCGIIKENTLLYRHVLTQGDNLKGLIQLSMGDMVGKPKVLPNRYAMRAELRTFLEPGTVDNCIDLKLAKTVEDIELFVQHSDQAIVPDAEEGGMKLANVYLTGANREECFDKMNGICEKIIKQGSKMNWKVERIMQQQF